MVPLQQVPSPLQDPWSAVQVGAEEGEEEGEEEGAEEGAEEGEEVGLKDGTLVGLEVFFALPDFFLLG